MSLGLYYLIASIAIIAVVFFCVPFIFQPNFTVCLRACLPACLPAVPFLWYPFSDNNDNKFYIAIAAPNDFIYFGEIASNKQGQQQVLLPANTC